MIIYSDESAQKWIFKTKGKKAFLQFFAKCFAYRQLFAELSYLTLHKQILEFAKKEKNREERINNKNIRCDCFFSDQPLYDNILHLV